MNTPDQPARCTELLAATRTKYRGVAVSPSGHFPYPVGRESALALGYRPQWIDRIPAAVVDRFVGVGNPFAIREPESGMRVLDLGCGAGMDALVAAQLVGKQGRSVGVDLTPEMLESARSAAGAWQTGNVEFIEGTFENLPFADESFDMVISNGALNLAPDKDRVFREIHRVLAPGGTLAVADLLVIATIPDEVLQSMDAWSS